MSLLQLLTTGRCFTVLREPVGRYRMTDPRAMPKFGSAKAPGAVAATSELPVCEATAPANAQEVEGAGSSAVSQPKVPPDAGIPIVAAGPAEAPKSLSAHNSGVGIFCWVARVRQRLMARFSRRPLLQSVPAVSRPTKTAVQGELLLDLVRVVRNDLSDSDLEIVAAKTPAAQMNPAAAAAAKSQRSAGILSRAATRLFTSAKL
jgi:hypothetical protein